MKGEPPASGMGMIKTKNIAAILAVLLMMSGCAANSSTTSETTAQMSTAAETTTAETTAAAEETTTAETTTVTTAEETTTTEETAAQEENIYMEKYGDKIQELAPEEIYEKREGVIYPEFEKHTYYSQTAERDTNVNVLLPANFDESREYPVLYILHGYWDNEDWMTRDNVHLATMLTNLIADGEAEEMIVVCPYIFCSKELPSCTGMDNTNTLAYDNFINDMMTDLMPYIEENFPVKKGRENTAITGFSMGGRESLFIAATHPELFGYVGSSNSAPGLIKGIGFPPSNIEKDELSFKGDNVPYVLMISASKSDGVVGDSPFTYADVLTENGNAPLMHVMEKTNHDATSVAPHLYNFFRLIFKD